MQEKYLNLLNTSQITQKKFSYQKIIKLNKVIVAATKF